MKKSILNLVFISTIFWCFSLASKAGASEYSYVLAGGDKIQIQVYGEPELSFKDLLLNANGTFEYPYLGQLTAVNKTPQQLQKEIFDGLKGDYLVEPKVMVSILKYRKIFVNGEVKRPGGYEYQPGLTVDKAITLAGGFTDRASRRDITLDNESNEMKSLQVTPSYPVKPGDIITIEESFF